MVESRCGILCNGCSWQEKVGCKGCLNIEKPFWSDSCAVKACCEGKSLEHCGQCAEFPCELAKSFAYDEKEGDGGIRLEQCKKWCQECTRQES